MPRAYQALHRSGAWLVEALACVLESTWVRSAVWVRRRGHELDLIRVYRFGISGHRLGWIRFHWPRFGLDLIGPRPS
jgi:hypothetical protein